MDNNFYQMTEEYINGLRELRDRIDSLITSYERSKTKNQYNTTLRDILENEQLTVRTRNTLYRGFGKIKEWDGIKKRWNIEKYADIDTYLVDISRNDLRTVNGFGKKCYDEIVEVFKKYGWEE